METKQRKTRKITHIGCSKTYSNFYFVFWLSFSLWLLVPAITSFHLFIFHYVPSRDINNFYFKQIPITIHRKVHSKSFPPDIQYIIIRHKDFFFKLFLCFVALLYFSVAARKATWGRSSLFQHIGILHEGYSGPKPQGRHRRQELSKGYRRMLLADLLLLACSTCLSYQKYYMQDRQID